MKLLVIIPAFNEASVIGSVIASVKTNLPTADILIVDDGSSDATSEQAKKHDVTVVRHIVNRGLGGAIGTGLAFAKRHAYDIAITLDADGQHDPKDAQTMIALLQKDKFDLVIGSRLVKGMLEMPSDRRLLNWLANAITFLLFGVKTTDSQSGFRAFNRKAIQTISLKTERMEVSSEIFAEINRLHLRFAEVPISVIYTDYSRAKGQQNSNKWSVGYKLMLRLFR
jgi:glycosyltransferase involved in cell wall biosynthesis